MLELVAIHQPNYLPWLGFFYKIYRSNHFVLLDDVPYSKGSYTARAAYRKYPEQKERAYLSVPIKKRSLGTPIFEYSIDHSKDWPNRHLNCLTSIYRKAPCFDAYFPLLSEWMQAAPAYTNLADWNTFLIEEISQLLGLKATRHFASQLPVSGKSTAYLVALVKHLSGDAYLCGQGAKKYQDNSLFELANIELEYMDYYTYLEQNAYPQVQGPWLNGLSVIDALMNIGVNGIIELFENYPKKNKIDV